MKSLNLSASLNQASLCETHLNKEEVTTQSNKPETTKQQITDIIQACSDLVWVKDLNGVYLSCNLPFERYIGFTNAQIVGRTDFDLTTHEEAESFRAHDRQTIGTRDATVIEEMHIPANGTQPRLFEIIKTPVYDAAGQITGVQGIGRDITQRRAAETALQEANAQRHVLELCIARLNDVVVITEAEPIDHPGPRIVFVNDAFQRMTGYSRAEALGQSPRLLQGPKSQLGELARIRQALAAWQPVHAELINYKKNGDQFWVEIDIVPVANAQGWYTHWIAVQRDITERKAADAEMLYICDRAMEASRLKSEFLSSISHEMRTPMNGVIGMANLLLGTKLDDKQQLYASLIASSATEYMQVIEKALDFSKLDAGQLAIDNLPFELAPMLKGVESVIRPKAESKKLTLRCALDTALTLRFLGDERRVRQCLLFLLDNAVKFTSKGQIDLVVTSVQLPGQASALRFEVTDTGIGLTDGDRVRLFHPFVQGDGSLSRRYGGIGLGLIICQQMVTLMQGCMGVQSTPGEGSTFWFELPLRATP